MRDRKPKQVVAAKDLRRGDLIVTRVGEYRVSHVDINTSKPAPQQVRVSCGETWTSFYYQGEEVTIVNRSYE